MDDTERLHKGYLKSEYYYLVEESASTLGKDPGEHGPYRTVTEFKGNNLLKSREEAIEFFEERLDWARNGSYFLPFASPKNFVEGENARYSIYLIFVRRDPESGMIDPEYEIEEYILYGSGDDATEKEALEFESLILKLKGFSQPKPFK